MAVNTQQLRKALGVLKDSTLVGLAKVNSDYKGLDVSIVKATNHVEVIPKEKHVRKIFNAISSSRPRADVAYCINSLTRRLAKTSNWAVALKTLVVIHRALREVDPSFREELMKYRINRPQMLNLSHFKDDSSIPAWDYSAWVRSYALFLEEKLECFRILKYDIENERNRTRELDTIELLEQLPALQNLLFRLVCCQPEGAAVHNNLIRFAFSMVAHESIKVYAVISGGTHNLADQFFDMERHDAIRALEIYRKAANQKESLNVFYKICTRLELGRPIDFKKVEEPPESFLGAMEEYIKNTSHQNKVENGREILAIEYKKSNEEAEINASSNSNLPRFADLLCMDDFTQNEIVNEVEEQNPLALALVSNDNLTNQGVSASINTMEDWELALVSAPVSNQTPITNIKLAGGLEALNLDSLYNDAIARESTNLDLGFPIGDQTAPNPFEIIPFGTEITTTNVPIGTEIDLFGPNTEITPNNVTIGTEIDLFTPNTEITTNNVPIGTEIDLFAPYTEITPNNVPNGTPFFAPNSEINPDDFSFGADDTFFASNTETTHNNVRVGTEMDSFFAPNTEIAPNTVPIGSEMDSFFAPNVETTPNTVPVGTEIDLFSLPNREVISSNVPIGTELGQEGELLMTRQKENTNNPFGNPFM